MTEIEAYIYSILPNINIAFALVFVFGVFFIGIMIFIDWLQRRGNND